ncbi:MAG: hypothetical protein QM802_10495 [Agriterribacter sp.]
MYDTLTSYQSSLLHVDPELSQEFKDVTLISTFFPDTLHHNYTGFKQAFINAESFDACIGLLNVLTNRIRKTENKMVTFCYLKTGCLDCDGYESVHVLLSQDKSIVIPGETIEIMAGLGSFSMSVKPEVRIFGKKVLNEENGVAVFKFTASKSIGKYNVPVTIDYIDENTGAQKRVSKTITYTVR